MCRLSDCKSICMSPCLLVYLSSWLSGRVASRNFLFFSDDWFALGNSVYNSYSSGGLFWSIVLAFYSPLDLTKVIPFNERFGYSIGRQKQSLNPSTVRKCKSALFWSGREQQIGGGELDRWARERPIAQCSWGFLLTRNSICRRRLAISNDFRSCDDFCRCSKSCRLQSLPTTSGLFKLSMAFSALSY